MCEINHITIIIKNQLNVIKLAEDGKPQEFPAIKRSRSNDVI